MRNIGVIYTASGKRYVAEAIYSAKTLKRHNKRLKATLFTSDKGIKSRYFDEIIFQPPVKHPQKYKIENMLNSPYEYTLYLDSDTEIKDKIEELFDFLLIYDMGLTNRVKCSWGNPVKYIDFIDEECYNGGFLLFKKMESVNNFLKAWFDKMLLNEDDQIRPGTPTGDQQPLNDLIFKENLLETLNVKYVILPNKIYNARPWLWKSAKDLGEYGNIKIFHSKGLNKSKFVKFKDKIIHNLKNG